MKVAVVALLLALCGVAGAQVMSPGPLHATHAKLDTDDDCGKCHESGNKVVARLCLDCHKDLGAEISAGRGLHGVSYKGKGCEECHVEHVGRNSKLVRWPGGAMEKLDHRQTGYALEGKHAPVKCLDCHKKTSPMGRAQFVATPTACSACHKDPHGGKLGSDCAKCHAVTKEFAAFDQKAFDHKTTRFELTGKHVDVACEKCHTGSGAPPKWKPLQFATCEACHQDPHNRQFKPKACTGCHDTRSWEVATAAIKGNHPKLSLANGHARVGCKTCHDRGNDKPPSKGSTCIGCHPNVHLAKFGNRCETCHASIKWAGLPDSVGRDNHGKTRYTLTGKHVSTACGACHKASKPLAQRYRNLEFAQCTPCHADKHAGEFASRKGGECSQCHTVQGFSPTLFGLADHATTKFSLDGKHAATPCSACHTGPRPRLAFTVAKQQCADCHANPHGTQFDNELAQGGCARCHTPLDWHQAKIDHKTWPLVGAHARTACTMCHGEQKKGAEPAAYRGVPRDCEGCHDDIHAGQFTQTTPKKTCQTCHSAETFKIARTFDHKTTRYPLEGKHIPLACDQCHKPETLRNGSTAVRWRLGYLQCKDCHANPHREVAR